MGRPRKHPDEGRRVYVPKEDFWTDVDGVPTLFKRDMTRVREGHDLLRTHGNLFEVIHVQYDVEQATDAPGELREDRVA